MTKQTNSQPETGVLEANRHRRPEVEAVLNNPVNRYLAWRQLDDGTYVGMFELIYTVAIAIDIDCSGFAKRFCFNDPDLAAQQFERLSDQDSEPIGWIARR